MLSGGDCREVPSSSSLYPVQNYVGTASPTEASPVPWSQEQQTLLSKNHFYMDFGSKEGNCRRILSERPNYSVHVGDNILRNNPLLLQLLMTDDNNSSNDAFLLSQQSKTTPRPTTEASFSPTVSNTMSNENKNLDDDQILKLIEKKLTYFRAQMKARRSGSFSKNPNAEQHPTPGTSVPRALDDNISKDPRESKASGGSIDNPEMSRVKDNGPAEYVRIRQEAAAVISQKEDRHVVLQALGSVATVKDLVKHRPTFTLQNKPSNQKYNSVWRNNNPFLSLDKERDLHSVKNKMKAADDLPGVDFSKLSQSALTSSALETAERESCHTKRSRQKVPQPSDSEDVRMHLSQTSNPKTDVATIPSSLGGHMKECKQQLREGTQEKKVETGEDKMERGLFDRMLEILKPPVFDDISDDEGANGTQPISAPSLSLQNKDIHENLPAQLSRHLANATPAENVNTDSTTSQFRQVRIQLENIGKGEGPSPENGTIQVEISRPPEHNLNRKSCAKSKTEHLEACSPNWKLQCSCPFFVEIEDGFEQRPCPKCALECSSVNWKDDSTPKQEEDPLPKQGADTLSNEQHFSQTLDSGSEDCSDTHLASDSQYKTVTDTKYEEDEWFVVNLTISDVKLEEIIVLDDADDDGEESGHPLSHEPLNQPIQSYFQKLPEFDSLPSFLQSKSLQYNLEVPLEVSNAPLSVQLPLASISLPKLGAVEKAASEPTSVTSIEAEDSCDTDDSSDYPLQTKRNYLTASSRVKAPSPLRRVSESVEEGEVAQAPGTISPGSPPASTSINIFSCIISDDEDSNTANDPIIASTMTKMLCKDAFETKVGKKRSKSKKKVPRIVSEDDDDADEQLNQNRKLKRRRSDTSESCKVSSQPKQPALRTRSIQARFEQNDRVSSSVSSKGLCQVDQRQAVKRKKPSENSSSDHIRKVRRSSPEAAESMVQEMPEKQPKTNASNTTNQNFRRQLSQPSVPTKAKDLRGSPLTKTLSLNGEWFHASSLPGRNQSQPEPQNSSPPKPNQVNSYSTDKSTEAKKKLVGIWASEHVAPLPKMMRRRRTTSNEQSASSHNNVVNMPNRKDLEYSAQRKRNPPRTALMKKTVFEAVQLTHHMHRQATTEQNPDKTFSGYKWKKSHTDDFDWEREKDGCSPEHPKGLAEY